MSEYAEKCQRCGEVGEDRRTLWMACFYAMNELGLPFEQKTMFTAALEDLHKVKDPLKISLRSGEEINLGPGTVKCTGELTPHGFFTLRVCKACRASWMDTLKQWFERIVNVEPVSSGIFVRRNGTNVEISEEEWYRLNPGREPVRVMKVE